MCLDFRIFDDGLLSLYDRYDILLVFLCKRNRGGGRNACYYFISIYSLSISLRRLNMIEILFTDPLQLTYLTLNYMYCKLVEHRGHVSRYTVCSHT